MKWVIVGKRKITAELDGVPTQYAPGYEGPMEDEWAIHFARAQALSVLGDASEFEGEAAQAEESTGEDDSESAEDAGEEESTGEAEAPKPKRKTRARKPAA